MRWDRSSGRARNRTSRVPPWEANTRASSLGTGAVLHAVAMHRACAVAGARAPHTSTSPGSVKLAACRVAVYLVM